MFDTERPRNTLLARLPAADYQRLARDLEAVTLPDKHILSEPDERIDYAYFPVSGVVSIIMLMRNGGAAEAGIVGREGMIGLPLLVNDFVSPYRMIQQVPGVSLRIPAAALVEMLRSSPALRQLVERYALAVLQQSAQNAACHLLHGLDQRLCRWLLATQDRVGADTFYLTQEFLAQMLGVQRQTVNQSAGALQRAEVIAYRRGNVRVLNRHGLERLTCECYEQTRAVYERMLALP
jgi:CRP-like cAMP-binding protein